MRSRWCPWRLTGVFSILLLFAALATAADVPAPAVPAGKVPAAPEPEWVAPSPPPLPTGRNRKAKPCKPATSHPVVSYRISARCAVTDVRPIGGYRYGLHRVERKVREFGSSRQVRRFEHGSFRYVREITIALHRAVSAASHLVCHVDMMGRRVIDAKIVSVGPAGDVKESRTVETPLKVANGNLPELGVYTYGEEVPYPAGTCPADR